ARNRARDLPVGGAQEEELTVLTLSRRRSLWLVLLAGSLLPACTMGPDYRKPEVELPAVHRGTGDVVTTASLADLEWFELFRDQQLTELVSAALQDSFEVRIAAE